METFSMTMAKRQLVDSIWKSAGIEGLGTTFPNTDAILNNLPVKTTREEVFFVVNMKRAWEFLFDNVEYPNNIMFLRELNKIVIDGKYGAGEIRKAPVSIGGTSWTPDMPNSAEIIEDLRNLAKNEDKVDFALETFCYIARKQMFIDGNKRVAQLMTNKILIENDLGIFSVPYNKISEFKEKLVDFYETNDNSELKQFFTDFCLILNPDYLESKENEPNGDFTDL